MKNIKTFNESSNLDSITITKEELKSFLVYFQDTVRVREETTFSDESVRIIKFLIPDWDGDYNLDAYDFDLDFIN